MKQPIPKSFNPVIFIGKLVLLAAFMPLFCSAQGIVNNGASIVLKNGSGSFVKIYIDGITGNYLNQTAAGVNGTIVNYNPGATITLKGSWTNNATASSNITNAQATTNGVIINDSCTVVFAGTSPGTTQTISGATYGTSFYNLVFSGSSPKAFTTVASSVKSTVSVSSGTTVNAGTTAGLGLTFLSSATKTATLAPLPDNTAVVTGVANVQRFLTGGSLSYRGYRLLSSPVYAGTNGGTNYFGVKYLNTTLNGQAGAFIGGPGGPANGFDVNNAPTVFFYNESRTNSSASFTAGKWMGIAAITPPTISLLAGTTTTAGYYPWVGNGYLFFFIGSTDTRTSGTTAIVPNNTTITATGTPNQGTIPVKIVSNGSTFMSYTTGTGAAIPGLNMVGNPYASTISLNKFYSDNYNAGSNAIGSIFYEMAEPGSFWVSYDASNGHTNSSMVSNYIASGEGFVVTATGTGQQVSFKEDQKVTTQLGGTAPLLLSLVRPAKVSAGLHLQLMQANIPNNVINCQTGIYFDSYAADTYKLTEDAVDLGSTSGQLNLASFTPDGVRCSINDMSDYLKGKRVKLFVCAAKSGPYQLSLADIKNIDSLHNVYLVDKLLKDSVNLRTTATYNFNVDLSDTTTFGANRFVLAVELQALPPYKLLSFTGEKTSAGVKLSWKTQNESTYTGFTVQKLVGAAYTDLGSLQSTGAGTYTFTDTKPAPGHNTYRLEQNGITGAITYSNDVVVDENIFGPGSLLSVYPNPTRDIVNIAVNATGTGYVFSIYNSMGAIIRKITAKGTYASENVSSFNPGAYVIEAYDSKGKYIGKTKFVKVR